jgi:hypothetical protein
MKVSITLRNGLGDKLLDLIGFFIICKYLNYTPYVSFDNHGAFAWGGTHYDNRLFNFNEINISHEPCEYYVYSPSPSSSLSPYKVYEFIKRFIPEITFEQISNDFVVYSKIIQPSDIILSKIPKNIEKAYGIHLRKSDKVYNNCDMRHENSTNDFIIIINKLMEDITNIIIQESEPMFLVVSEDNKWKNDITMYIMNISRKHNKKTKIIELDYTNDNYSNFPSVLDMFCLSKCKEILQGVKYSTFSIVASLLGNHKLRNYSKYLDSYPICLIHAWSSVIDINDQKCFDQEHHRKVLNECLNVNSNIVCRG